MPLGEILWFELSYQSRRVATWVYAAILLGATLLASGELAGDYARTTGSTANGPFIIAVMSLLFSTLGLMIGCGVAGDAAVRDVQARMAPLVYTAPVSKAAYLGGRFLAAFVLFAAILLTVPLGFMLLVVTAGPSEIVGPFRAASYVDAYLFVVLPNAFVATAVLFSLAALGRRATLAYVGGLLLVSASAFAWTVVAGTSGRWDLAKLLDPLGATILAELSMTWTPAEWSTRAIDLGGALLWNRLLWIGVAAGVLALTHVRFRFAHHTTSAAWSRGVRAADTAPWHGDVHALATIPVRRAFDAWTRTGQLIGVARDSWHAIVAGRGAVLLVATAVFLVFSSTPIAHMGVPLFATAERMIAVLAAPLASPQEINWIVVPLIIGFLAGDVVWRERDARLHELTDAAPVPDWVLFFGKFAGLGLVLATLQAVMMVAAMVAQRVLGYTDFDIGLYARTLFGLQLADYLLFAMLALVIHTLVNHKYVGHLLVVMAYGVMTGGRALGLEHNLLVYGGDPGWMYSDMRGFEPFIGGWLWFKLYWCAWAALLAMVATLLRVRGRNAGFGSRLEQGRRRMTRGTAGAVVAAVVLIVTVGGFIFYNTNVLHAYRPASAGLASRADYERRYGSFKGIPQPRLTGVNLRVEIHPDARHVEIVGTYRLVNSTDAAIDTVHLATKPAVRTTAVRFDRDAKPVALDEQAGHRIYALEMPLRPGESLQLHFELQSTPSGFPNRGIDASVVSNGTYFTNAAWLPAIGYQPGRELRGAGERRAYGLPALSEGAMPDEGEARRGDGDAARIAFEAVVGTNEGQVAVAAGTLRRTWTEHGRRYFHYVTDAPIRNDYAIFSAAYAEARSGQAPEIQVFSHPAHAWNVDRMVRSVRASLDYLTSEYGAYPHRQIRLVEHPGGSVLLHAAPTTIAYEEGFALLNPDADARDIDLPFAVVAHEVAHQWWGNALTPARVDGAAVLTETLAWYSALEVVERTHGRGHLERLLGMMRQAYLTPRARADVPLLRADDWFLAYRKGPLAMYALREYAGAEPVRQALQRLFVTHGSGTPPLPTPLDLYRELQAAVPQPLHGLLADLFETNTFWELATERAGVEQTGPGEWRVALDVRARKVSVDTAGVETVAPMDDLVELGVFANAEGEGGTPRRSTCGSIESGTACSASP